MPSSEAYIDYRNYLDIFAAMANSALHAIAIEDLRISHPAFHQEYCLLVEGISNLIFRLAKKHGDYITYSTFTESYDRASKEPILQMVLGSHKNEFYLHIYISKDGGFIIGKNGMGSSAQTGAQALSFIEEEIHQAGWL
jgi:hypothetical protein